MSKKLTFKGVAISAIVALGMTGIVGVSAYAAPSGTVTLAPTTGTEYYVAAGNNVDFSLTSSNTSDAIGSTGLLKWKIEAPTADDENVVPYNVNATPTTVGGDTDLGDLVDAWYQDNSLIHLYFSNASSYVAVGSEIQVTRSLGTRTDSAGAGDGTDTVGYSAYTSEVVRVTAVGSNYIQYVTGLPQGTVASNTPGNQGDGSSSSWGGKYVISYGNTWGGSYSSGVTVVDSRHNAASFNKTLVLRKDDNNILTRTVNVTAWVDIDDDGVIDADEETVSPTRTVTFINPTTVTLDATSGFTFAGPAVGQTTVTSSIKTNPVLNQDQSTLVPRTAFTKQFYSGNVLTTPTSFWGGSARSTDASVITSTSAAQSAFVAGFYTGRPYLTATGAASNTASDYATTYPLGAAVSRTVAADRVYDIIGSVAGSANTTPVETYSSATSYVRLGTASVTVNGLAVADGDDTPVGAGKTVVATLSDTTNFKLNGGTSAVTLTTNGSGQVSVAVTKNTATTAGSATVTFTSTRIDGTNVDTSVTLTWEAASYELFNLNDSLSYTFEQYNSIKAGQSISFAFAYHDQWKVPAPTASYRVVYDLSQTGSNTVISGQNLSWSGNTANLTVTSNGTVGSEVIDIVVWVETNSSGSWVRETDFEDIYVDVVASTQNFVVDVNSSDRDDIQHTTKVQSYDRRTSQASAPSYSSNYAVASGYVREAVTGLIRPFAKVSITGPSDFMFRETTSTNSVDRLGSLTAVADNSGNFYFEIYSNRSVTDEVVRVSVDGGTPVPVKISFDAPDQDYADAVKIDAPKSVKAGRTVTATVSVVDKWGNVTQEDDDLGGQAISVTSSRGFVGLTQSVEKYLTTYQVKVMLQPLDRGPVTLNAVWNDSDGSDDVLTGSTAVWAGPAVNATAGAKKGRVVVEAYRSVGKTVNVFVGSTKVASFVPNKANDKFVVKGLKKGNRKVTVKVTPGYDFSGVIAVK